MRGPVVVIDGPTLQRACHGAFFREDARLAPPLGPSGRPKSAPAVQNLDDVGSSAPRPPTISDDRRRPERIECLLVVERALRER
ncbi:MAG: hypothetical protein BGO98_30810 [Myxococcales bacterium 68-20]|nr:MAG: hypothetical protein BGO98_30810 [Myxococcales bacterium 68-20]